jgi:tetratricopeptide (TPR) repeat protein
MGGRKAKAGGKKSAGASMREQLSSAIALHRQGQLEEAEKAYLALLQSDQDHPEALHFLGVMRHQQGQSLQGIALVRRAIELRPDYVDAVNNLGNILQQTGTTADAAAGLEVIEIEKAHLRRDGEAYVEGLVVAAVRP